MKFRLYTEETSWWSFADHAIVMRVMERLKPNSVLEFGPGSSTLALIEGGATLIDCCEDDPVWFATYCERLEEAEVGKGIVRMRPYNWTPLNTITTIPGVDGRRYDLALIDGPRETKNRPAVLAYAMDRCPYVLVPLESGNGSTFMRKAVARLAKFDGRPVEWKECTGPKAGSFALIGPAC